MWWVIMACSGHFFHCCCHYCQCCCHWCCYCQCSCICASHLCSDYCSPGWQAHVFWRFSCSGARLPSSSYFCCSSGDLHHNPLSRPVDFSCPSTVCVRVFFESPPPTWSGSCNPSHSCLLFGDKTCFQSNKDDSSHLDQSRSQQAKKDMSGSKPTCAVSFCSQLTCFNLLLHAALPCTPFWPDLFLQNLSLLLWGQLCDHPADHTMLSCRCEDDHKGKKWDLGYWYVGKLYDGLGSSCQSPPLAHASSSCSTCDWQESYALDDDLPPPVHSIPSSSYSQGGEKWRCLLCRKVQWFMVWLWKDATAPYVWKGAVVGCEGHYLPQSSFVDARRESSHSVVFKGDHALCYIEAYLLLHLPPLISLVSDLPARCFKIINNDVSADSGSLGVEMLDEILPCLNMKVKKHYTVEDEPALRIQCFLKSAEGHVSRVEVLFICYVMEEMEVSSKMLLGCSLWWTGRW